MQQVSISHQPIELCKLLKIANLVSGGGEAKMLINEGLILVNGDVAYQKRKKIYHEDVIEFQGEQVSVKVEQPVSPLTPSIQSSAMIQGAVQQNSTQAPNQALKSIARVQPTPPITKPVKVKNKPQRKPISFS